MTSFTYNNEVFNINDEIIIKNIQKRLVKYKIIYFTEKKNFYDLKLKYSEEPYDKFTNYKLYTNKKRFIKKYISYNEPKEVYCRKMQKKENVYIFNCEFCNKPHKHNRLGKNDCKCISGYSPYYKCGYILKTSEFDFDNFNDYLFYNYKLLLQEQINNTSISWYSRYIKQFYLGTICNLYGKSVFPYLKPNTIDIINKKYSNEPKFKNLITTIRKFRKLMQTKELPYYSIQFKDEIQKLYTFYNNPFLNNDKNNNHSNSNNKSKNKNDSNSNNKSKNKNDSNSNNKDLIDSDYSSNSYSNNHNFNSSSDSSSDSNSDSDSDSCIYHNQTIYHRNNIDYDSDESTIEIPIITDSKFISLDIEDHIHEDLKKSQLDEIKSIIIKDPSNFLFYFKTVDKRNERLWITIQYYDNYIWGVNDTNLESKHFMDYKQEMIEEQNIRIRDCYCY